MTEMPRMTEIPKDNIPEFTDEEIVCVDCEQMFIFTAGEGEYFYRHCLSKPKRCKLCRAIRRRSIVPAGEREVE